MSTKISALPVAGSLVSTDVIPVVSGGVTKSATLAVIQATIGGGSGSVPTGTGVPHIVGGVQNAAASLIVNADVSAGAALDVSKLAPGTAAQVLVTNAGGTAWVGVTISGDATVSAAGVVAVGALTGVAGVVTGPAMAITLGATPATVGTIRMTDGNASMCKRNNANTFDLSLIDTSVDAMFVGVNPGYTANKTVASLNIYANAAVALGLGGGATYLYVNSGAIEAWQPISGSSIGSSPYALNGTGTQAMANADQTAAASVYRYAAILLTGANTAGHNLTLPTATDAQGYGKKIVNACTGVFSITVKCAAGTTVAIADGKTADVWIDSSGVRRLTADV